MDLYSKKFHALPICRLPLPTLFYQPEAVVKGTFLDFVGPNFITSCFKDKSAAWLPYEL